MLASWVTILLSDVVIVVSERDYLDAPVLFSRKKLVLIKNGISPFDFLDTKDARTKLSKQQHIPIEAPWILALGELHTNKGFDLAIQALPETLKEYPNAVLVIIGEGEERAKLEKLILELHLSEHVFLLGFISEPRRYLKAADVFIVSSRKEGLPYALLEAGMAGLPVIATNVGGIPEVIDSGDTGLLVLPNDIAGLSRAMKEVLRNRTFAERMGMNLEAKIRKDFSEETMLAQTVETYFS
jgi:glycosyltransferase involved in cell wall biosynthesis